MSQEDSDRIVPLLAVFCSLFSLLIATLHDSEFYADDNTAGMCSAFFFLKKRSVEPYIIVKYLKLLLHIF